jgi:hypothetical protein
MPITSVDVGFRTISKRQLIYLQELSSNIFNTLCVITLLVERDNITTPSPQHFFCLSTMKATPKIKSMGMSFENVLCA